MKTLTFAVYAMSLGVGICPAHGQTLNNAATWRDVSRFIEQHKIPQSLATLYVLQHCRGLPAQSQSICLKEVFSTPESYQGLSMDWVEKTTANLKERLAEEERAQALKQQISNALRIAEEERREAAQVTAEIGLLRRQIGEHETARKSVEENLGTLQEDERKQARELLERYDTDLKELQARLRILVNEN